MIKDQELVFSGHNGSIGSQRPTNSQYVTSLLQSSLEDKVKELQNLSPMPKAFIHLAAMASVKECEADPDRCHHLNVDGSVQWFEACQQVGIEKFVFVSTSHVYDSAACDRALDTDAPLAPQHEYGKSKLRAEQKLKELVQGGKTSLHIARVFSVLADPGPPWSLMEGLKRRAKNQDFSPIPGLSSVRDFLTNKEVCERLIAIAKSEKDLPDVLNVCSGFGISVREVAEKVFEEHGLPVDKLVEAKDQGGTPTIIGVPTPLA